MGVLQKQEAFEAINAFGTKENWLQESRQVKDPFLKCKYFVYFILPKNLQPVRDAINKFNGDNLDILRGYVSTVFYGMGFALKKDLAKIEATDGEVSSEAKAVLEVGINKFLSFDREVIHQVQVKNLSTNPERRTAQSNKMKQEMLKKLDAYLLDLKISLELYERGRRKK